MLAFLLTLLVCSVICSLAAAGNLYPQANLLALGLALFAIFALVSLLQVGQRLF